jgi:chromate reductase
VGEGGQSDAHGEVRSLASLTVSRDHALKNAIDWASRPYSQNAFTRKPSAITGTSPGKIGTAVAQQHLRSILAFCNSPLMNAVEA